MINYLDHASSSTTTTRHVSTTSTRISPKLFGRDILLVATGQVVRNFFFSQELAVHIDSLTSFVLQTHALFEYFCYYNHTLCDSCTRRM